MDKHRLGYASGKRKELLAALRPHFSMIINQQTGIAARLSKKSVDKMTSEKAIAKSKRNGFSLDEHFSVAAEITSLYENASLIISHGNLKNPDDPNVVSVKRFVAQHILQSGKELDALTTVKESLEQGHKIYSIELEAINKAPERFKGLSDVTANAANRATKTPHIDDYTV